MTIYNLRAQCEADSEPEAINKFLDKLPYLLANGFRVDGSVQVELTHPPTEEEMEEMSR